MPNNTSETNRYLLWRLLQNPKMSQGEFARRTGAGRGKVRAYKVLQAKLRHCQQKQLGSGMDLPKEAGFIS